jgi:hypothetical protein
MHRLHRIAARAALPWRVPIRSEEASVTDAPASPDTHRYPIGKFRPAADPTDAMRAGWIDDIARCPAEVARLVDGLTRDQLLTPYRDGGWTVAQVVHHMADSHANAHIRTRFALAETGFVVKPYDEARWATFPDAADANVQPSLDILRGLHARWTTLLRSLAPADFDRPLVHPERGPITVGWLANLYAWHGQHHAAHIAGLRARRGW